MALAHSSTRFIPFHSLFILLGLLNDIFKSRIYIFLRKEEVLLLSVTHSVREVELVTPVLCRVTAAFDTCVMAQSHNLNNFIMLAK
jgi:hypothetical protein